ncbi:flagellar basal-body rod protein FlgF [Aeromonas simiae]|uniref:flagellar basal-body rod protein FlgF n=1 Tax=Aeromonas simiae TaxID=218936 RepID=UPI0005A82FA0|nr:flagellar basal-body rod protein FlgF [Aeromonas simiae]MDO2947324.1 flagellar basal-body rod protein FlgF [Aeromonas simiae]MDO2951136.1 flagellar basal-body rod protein FlgF [Aeromonas simiae]MDO2954720.1 flagellar basal-body rod protein FlgF [Aeromonas simiae]
MDHLLYIAMSGAKENMNSLAVRSNNLANANTVGFKSDFEQARSMQAFGDGLPSRVFSKTERPGQNLEHGMLMTTGRDLDVALDGQGWIAVQDPKGGEAFTRMGNLQLSATGNLQTSTGLNVVDDAGSPIVLPLPLEKIEITRDGTVSGRPEGAAANLSEDFQRIKLVNPASDTVEKGEDGLFRRKDGKAEPAAAGVGLIAGSLEGSNVNVVDEMTNLIRLQRQFETQIKMMKTAEENDEAQTQLLRLS